MADRYIINTTNAEISDKTNIKLFGESATGTPGWASWPTSSTVKFKDRSVYDKLTDGLSVKDNGANGDGGDDTDAFVATAEVSSSFTVPSGSYVANLTPSNAEKVLESLSGINVAGDLLLNLGAGVYNIDTLVLNSVNGGRITIAGATPIGTNITAGTPSVVVTPVTAYRNYYDVNIGVSNASLFSVGDWVIVKTNGTSLTLSSFDHTANGARHNEIDGFWKVVAVDVDGANSLTVRNLSRQSANQFPGAGTIAPEMSNYTGGTVTKIRSILSFSGSDGISVLSGFGNLINVGIIGDNSGSSTAGIILDSFNASAANQSRSIGLYNVGISGFTGSGVNCEGANSSISGVNVFSCGNGAHGFRIKGSVATLESSIAAGNGDTAGNGFFVTGTGRLYCTSSTAHGNRNTGFIANRASNLSTESSISLNNGNYAQEVVEGWVEREGKGYECEACSTMYCGTCVAICNTENGFYSLAGSKMDAQEAISCGNLHGYGFYAILGSTINARYAISNSNQAGFIANFDSDIIADSSYALGNTLNDYRARGGSVIVSSGALASGSTYNIEKNYQCGNLIVSDVSTDTPASRLILTPGATLTINSGAVTVTHSNHPIDTEGSASSDDLDTINGGTDGMVIVLRTTNSSRDVVVKHGTGNILLDSLTDKTLSDLADRIVLIYRSATAKWHQFSFSNNA